MAKANKNIMLMDVAKIGKNMPYTFATFEDIDVLICDDELPDNIKMVAQSLGVKIV